MGSNNGRKTSARKSSKPKVDDGLMARMRRGDRDAFHTLFLQHLPLLDRFVHHKIRYAERTGAVERGLIEPCAIVDQVYIAAEASVKQMPDRIDMQTWLRFLALHILRQQVRLEHLAEPAGLPLQGRAPSEGDADSDLWEFYQPDDVAKLEDQVTDRSSGDPLLWLEQRETETEIQEKMDHLPPELREAVRLRLIDGLNATEIAKLKDVPMESVRQAIRDACQALRQEVRPDG